MIKRNLNVFIVLFGLAQSTQALAIHFPIAEPIGAALAVEGNWFKVIQLYFSQGMMVIGLALSVLAFIWVGYAALSKFNEVREGRAEWGQLAVLTVVGCVILTVNAILLDQMQPIAQQVTEKEIPKKPEEPFKKIKKGPSGVDDNQEIPF